MVEKVYWDKAVEKCHARSLSALLGKDATAAACESSDGRTREE